MQGWRPMKLFTPPMGSSYQKGLGSIFLYANRQRGLEWMSGHRKSGAEVGSASSILTYGLEMPDFT